MAIRRDGSAALRDHAVVGRHEERSAQTAW
jgi:hypothetical protein